MRLAHSFAVPLSYWVIDPIARRRDDVTGIPLIVAPKCPYTSDWRSVIAMPYDARLLSGVTVLMAVVEAGSMARAAEALGLTSSGVGRAIGVGNTGRRAASRAHHTHHDSHRRRKTLLRGSRAAS